MSRSPSPRRGPPRCPNGLFILDEQCTVVLDADEEILELYMDLANTSPDTRFAYLKNTSSESGSGGLGFLDSSKALLELAWDLVPVDDGRSNVVSTRDALGSSPPAGPTHKLAQSGRKRRSVKREEERSIHIELKLHQDLTMLKASRGDTGSVLWRSSYYLAQHLLTQYHFPPSLPSVPLLDPLALSRARILELGSGTGLLAILLRSLCTQYTASDRWENLKLIKRNMQHNEVELAGERSVVKTSKEKLKRPGGSGGEVDAGGHGEVQLEEIDWVAVSEERRHRLNRPLSGGPGPKEYDLILCVDCIFNEHLIQPLVETLAEYCPKGGKTVVWIVAELRSSEVMTKFLETWIGDTSGPWTIVRLSSEAMGRWDGRKPRWVGWVGWR